MVTACLIATTMNLDRDESISGMEPNSVVDDYDAIDGPSEEEAYLQGGLLSNPALQHYELTKLLQGNTRSFFSSSVFSRMEKLQRG